MPKLYILWYEVYYFYILGDCIAYVLERKKQGVIVHHDKVIQLLRLWKSVFLFFTSDQPPHLFQFQWCILCKDFLSVVFIFGGNSDLSSLRPLNSTPCYVSIKMQRQLIPKLFLKYTLFFAINHLFNAYRKLSSFFIHIFLGLKNTCIQGNMSFQSQMRMSCFSGIFYTEYPS